MFKRTLLTLIALAVFATPALAKTIVFGSDCTWPPMEFLNEDKEIVGFSVDLLQAMGKAGGFSPEIKNVAWDGIFAGLAAGKYDAISSSVTITEERKKGMDFSDPYFEVKQACVVHKDSGIKGPEDLKGKTAGAQIGTTGHFTIKDLEGVEVKSYDEIGLAMEDLYSGRIQAVVADDPIAANYALQQAQYAAKFTIPFQFEAKDKEMLGFAVQKGDAETLELINKGLAAVKASGEYDQIVAKWFK